MFKKKDVKDVKNDKNTGDDVKKKPAIKDDTPDASDYEQEKPVQTKPDFVILFPSKADLVERVIEIRRKNAQSELNEFAALRKIAEPFLTPKKKERAVYRWNARKGRAERVDPNTGKVIKETIV